MVIGDGKGRKFAITNSYTTQDAYRWCIKNRTIPHDFPHKMFSIIVKTLNKELTEELINNTFIKLPRGMGKLELVKKPIRFYKKDGKQVITRPIDWYKTLELWNEDSECYKHRTLVKKEYSEFYTVLYNKSKAQYKNYDFYKFSIPRSTRKRISEKLKNKEIDALYELYQY